MAAADRWYRTALKLTEDSKHSRYKMAAVIVKNGSVLSRATNGPSKPLGKYSGGRHAEASALMPHHGDFRTADIVIARQGSKMSKPCSECMERIRAAGIRKIIYADWQGNITVELVVGNENDVSRKI